jgi:hypothetical protein
MDDLQTILTLIDGSICTLDATVANVVNQVNTLSYDLSTGLALKEDTANKSNGPLGSSTVLFPTENSVKTYVDTQDALNEKLANKVTTSADVIANGSSIIKYPAVKAIKDYVDGVTSGLLQDNGNYNPTITNNYPTSANTLSGGNPMTGDLWYISANGTMNGNAVLVGYSVRALVNNAGATNNADWAIANVGLGYIPENVANKISVGTDIITYSANTTKYTSSQSVYQFVTNAVSTASSALDLQAVLGNGHTLVNNINLQGTDAGLGQSGINVVLLGQEAGSNNSGSHVVGIGVEAVKNNTADNVIGIGEGAAVDNIGVGVVAIGGAGAQSNSGDGVFAIAGAANTNSGDYVVGIHDGAANQNTGNNVTAIGYYAGDSNIYNNVTLLGASAQASGDNQLVFSNAFGRNAQFSNANITGDKKYELPNASGIVPLTVNGIGADAVGNIVVPTGGGGGTVNTIKVTLPSSAILALNATPFQLIAPPGLGKTLNVLKIFFKYNYNTTVYSGGGSLTTSLNYGFGAIPVSNGIGGLLYQSSEAYAKPTMYTGSIVTTFGYANVGLYLTVTAPQTGGDGSLDVYITYDVVTL